MSAGSYVSLKDSIATRLLLVVLGLYLVIALGMTVIDIFAEYQYQKTNIVRDLEGIEGAFEDSLAADLQGLDERALRATVEGMLRIPTLVGVVIYNNENLMVAAGGVVVLGGKTAEVGLNVDLSGSNPEQKAVAESELISRKMFQRAFPVVYHAGGEHRQVGSAMVYSDSSVVYRGMKLQLVMLAINVMGTLLVFSMALLWAVNRYLRRPLRVLTNATARLSLSNLENFSVDIKTPERNEIKRLEETLTAMVSDLSGSVSKRVKAEQRLKESEQKFKAVFDNTFEFMGVLTLEGILVDVNRTALVFIGLEASEVRDKLFWETPWWAHSQEQKDWLREAIREAAGGKRVCAEVNNIGADGCIHDVDFSLSPVRDDKGHVTFLVAEGIDVTERKRAEKALEKRVVALTQPLGDTGELLFDELFNLEDIQHLQDEFSLATGVASIITRTDGEPITAPSNFCRLCNDIIRKTKKGCENCYKSDAALGRYNPDGPIIQPCMSGGLWDAGAAITVGGEHIANWLIGQVRDDTQSEERMREYARCIEANEDEVVAAFREVPSMSHAQFEKVAHALFTLANQLSTTAYQNVQQARFIAERRSAEEELHHLQNYLANIINSMPSVLVGVDADGVVTQWNHEAERSTGLSSEEAVGQRLDQAFARLSGEMGRVRDAMVSRQTRMNPKQSHQEGGETRYEDITVYPLVANGVEGAVIRVDDVTERVRIEEMMVQSEKMMSVGGLAAGMAHEINNPLAGMMQTADVMSDRLTNLELPSNLRAAEEIGVSMERISAYMEARGIVKMLRRIRESGLRMAEIVSNMLSFARKSESRSAMNDLSVLLDRSLDLAGSDYDLKKKYDFRQIEILREYEENVPEVACEAGKIQQVLLNLLRNAAEAMHADAREGCKPQFILRLAHEKEAGMVRIEIADNGPGMDAATRKRAFEPFFTTKTPDRGTGLGLSVSYFIVTENHGGTMSVESRPGEGSTFIIRLPIEGKSA